MYIRINYLAVAARLYVTAPLARASQHVDIIADISLDSRGLRGDPAGEQGEGGVKKLAAVVCRKIGRAHV